MYVCMYVYIYIYTYVFVISHATTRLGEGEFSGGGVWHFWESKSTCGSTQKVPMSKT